MTGATRLVAMVSPNNPTGGWATSDDLIRVATAVPNAVVMVDAAYAEFGEDDLTETAITLANAVVLRTFSKALGLAGLRIGYAMGPEPIINAMRSAGLPYPVSLPSIVLAQTVFGRSGSPPAYVKAVVEERRMLAKTPEQCDGTLAFSRQLCVRPRARRAMVSRRYGRHAASRSDAGPPQ